MFVRGGWGTGKVGKIIILEIKNLSVSRRVLYPKLKDRRKVNQCRYTDCTDSKSPKEL